MKETIAALFIELKDMASIEIRNFRHHQDLKVVFKDSSIHNVCGKSGAGKSTIFSAIYWCLYKKCVKIKPNDSKVKNVKTFVSITFTNRGGLKIIRHNQPHNLIVERGDEIYEGEPAQSFINENFGSSDVWLATSYLPQKKFNPLLYGSSSAKLELINRLAFHNEDPNKYIERTDVESTKIQAEITYIKSVFDQKLAILNMSLASNGVKGEDLSPSSLIPTGDIEVKQWKINSLKDQMRIEREKWKPLREQISFLRTNSAPCTSVEECDNKIKALESQLSGYAEQVAESNRVQKRKILGDSIKQFEGFFEKIDPIESPQQWSSSTISKRRRDEQLYQIKSSDANNLGIEYNKLAISEELARVSGIINAGIKYNKLAKEHEQNILKIELLERKLVDVNKEIDLNKVDPDDHKVSQEEYRKSVVVHEEMKVLHKDRIVFLRNNLNIGAMSCPHCSRVVRYQDSSLVKIEDYRPDDYKVELSKLERERTELILESSGDSTKFKEKFLKIDNKCRILETFNKIKEDTIAEIKSVKDQPLLENNFNNGSLSQEEYGIYYNKYSQLTSLFGTDYIELTGPSADEMEQHVNYLRMMDVKCKIDSLRKELRLILPASILCSQNVNIDPVGVRQEIQVLSMKKGTLASLEKLLDENPNIPDVLDLCDFDAQIMELEKCVSRNNLLVSLINERDTLIPLRHDLMSKTYKINTLARLKSAMIHSEYTSYQHVADQINFYLGTIVTKLFDEPISVKIDLFKTLKTKDRIKPTVNLKIIHNGYEKEALEMSGGEQERISLALTLALMKMSSSPIIIADETFASLGDTDQVKALEVLRRDGKEKSRVFLCVVHGTTAGWYDHTVKIGKNEAIFLE